MGIPDNTTALKSANSVVNTFHPARNHRPVDVLPLEPLTIIEASSGWRPVRFGELWQYRELLYFLIWRDLKVRYKQTFLGIAWVVMQPLLTTIVFSVFLGMLARVPSESFPYALFAYAGLLPWTFFATAVTNTGNSLVGNAHLITKIYFPRSIIPCAAIGARLVDLGVAFVILIGMLAYYRIAPTKNLLVLPLVVLLLWLFALAVGMWVSAMNVKYRDISIALPVLVQLWMFVSPVVYPSSLIPARWRWAYDLNPLVGIIENFRSAVLGRSFNLRAFAVSAIVAVAFFVYSAYAFRRMERDFADVV